MPVTYDSVDILCPFYMYERPCALICEGYYGTSLIQNFKNGDRKEDIKNKYCKDAYKSCAICQLLWAKYED